MTKPHFTFWVIAGLGLAWNLMGCMNFIMQTNPATVAQMPEIYQLIINTRPGWGTTAFAFSVFGGAVGCILLLLRRSVAVMVLILALGGTILVAVDSLMRVGMASSLLLSLLISFALLWYSTIAKRQGWLR